MSIIFHNIPTEMKREMNTIHITFEPLQDSHFPLLLRWLEAPHVKAWWDQDVHWNLELIKEKFGDCAKGYKLEKGVQKPIQAYVIYGDDHPLGYIQLYNAYDFSREDQIPLEGLPASLAAIDIFIGEEEYVGKGLGSLIMRQFLKEYVDPSYDACFVDPDTANVQAIRACEKAGFEKVKTVKEGTVTWMVRTKGA